MKISFQTPKDTALLFSKRVFVIKKMCITTLRYENLMVFEHPNVIIEDIQEFYVNWCKSV